MYVLPLYVLGELQKSDEHPAKSSVIATSLVNGHMRFTAVFSAPTLC